MANIPGTRIPISGTGRVIPGTRIPANSGRVVGIDDSGNIVTRRPGNNLGAFSSGSSSSGSVGGVSRAPIQSFAEGSFDPNTNTFTDKFGVKSSTTNPMGLVNKIRKKEQAKVLKAFSATGGLTGLGSKIKPSIKFNSVEKRGVCLRMFLELLQIVLILKEINVFW